jgi:hypothetical protein
MQTVIYDEYHYKVHYTEHRYAECLDKLENAQPCTYVGITSWGGMVANAKNCFAELSKLLHNKQNFLNSNFFDLSKYLNHSI